GPPYPVLPKSFLPWRAPLDCSLVWDTPSCSSCVSAGRLKRTQCVQMPRGASGSSQTSANVFVSSGPLDQRSGGEAFLPSAVYCWGILPPSWNLGLVTWSVIGAPPESEVRGQKSEVS